MSLRYLREGEGRNGTRFMEEKKLERKVGRQYAG